METQGLEMDGDGVVKWTGRGAELEPSGWHDQQSGATGESCKHVEPWRNPTVSKKKVLVGIRGCDCLIPSYLVSRLLEHH